MSSRWWWIACLLLGLAVQSGDRVAVAGEFDGTWVGKIGCRRDARPLQARVENSRFTANLGRGPAAVTGIIPADHFLNLFWDGDNYLYGKFHAERFEGRGEFSRGNCRFRLVREALPEPTFLGPHDGAWHLEEVTGCLAEEKIKGVIHVRGGDLNGIAIGFLTYEFAGSVNPDGGFEGLSSAYAISGRFEPDQGRADLQYRELDGACTGTAVLSRKWPSSAEQLAALPKPPEMAQVAAIGQTGDDERPPNPETPDTPTAAPKVDAPAAPSAIPNDLPAIPNPTPVPSLAEGPLLTKFEVNLARLRHLYYRGEVDDTEYGRRMRETFEEYDMPLPPNTYPSLEQQALLALPKPIPVPFPPEGPLLTEFEVKLARLRHLYYRSEIDDTAYGRRMRETFEEYDMPLPVGVIPSLEQPPVIVEPKQGTIDFGRYFALVIGNNDYVILRNLNTAVNDARVVADILENDYGYTVTLLIDATRAQIIDELDRLGRTIGDDDNFLIYYAGHGLLKKRADQGYWLPVDAEPDRRRNWISNADITDTLRAVRARHAIVVADSCFSGTLTRGDISENGTRSAEGYFSKISKIRSRNVLSSGGEEPVADGGGGGHSVFARAFIEELRANQKIIEGNGLAYKIIQRLRDDAEQTPIYGKIKQAGHVLGGDFIFVRKEFARSLKGGAE